jgi:putative toxin-antitoxin system antitoxin component (TIGR02293 family)
MANRKKGGLAQKTVEKKKKPALQVVHGGKSGAQKGGLVYWLGGTAHVSAPMRSDLDLVEAGRAGITKASLDILTEFTGLPRKKMAESILNVSVKTLERKADKEKLDTRISSHVIEIARLLQHAYAVFENEEKVRAWLSSGNEALDNKKPAELMDSLTGLGMLHDLLTRIEEGVYS